MLCVEMNTGRRLEAGMSDRRATTIQGRRDMQTRAVAVKVMRSLVDSAYSLEGVPTGFPDRQEQKSQKLWV